MATGSIDRTEGQNGNRGFNTWYIVARSVMSDQVSFRAQNAPGERIRSSRRRYRGGAMSKSGLIRTSGWIAGLLVSYVATFGMLALPLHTFAPMSRVGLICALVCSVGANVFFWARILASVAKKRGWSQRNCQVATSLVIIPGAILFLAGGSFMSTVNLLIQEALWTGMLCSKFVYPNFLSLGPFERDTPVTIFPK